MLQNKKDKHFIEKCLQMEQTYRHPIGWKVESKLNFQSHFLHFQSTVKQHDFCGLLLRYPVDSFFWTGITFSERERTCPNMSISSHKFSLLCGIGYFSRHKTISTTIQREFQLLPTSIVLCIEKTKYIRVWANKTWKQVDTRCLIFKTKSFAGRILTWIIHTPFCFSAFNNFN